MLNSWPDAWFLVPFFLSRRTQAPATASLLDLCCWVESVASFGCLAYLMVWWWQKPSGRIKAETSASEKGAARQRGLLHYKLTMAAPASSFFFYIYSAQQVSATAVSLPSLTPRGCFAPPYERKAWGKEGGSCRLGLGTWIQSWGAVSSSGVKVFSGEFLMFPTSWLFPDFSSASAEMSSTQFLVFFVFFSSRG